MEYESNAHCEIIVLDVLLYPMVKRTIDDVLYIK